MLIVVIIIAILAGTALPNYTRSVEKARMRDAEAKLNLIYQAERMYNLDIGGYATRTQLIPAYSLEPDTADFAFTITVGTPAGGYTATATRQGSSYAGSTIALQNTFTGTYTYSGNYSSNGNPS